MEHLTPNEWYVMECLWQNPNCTGREAVEFLKKTVGWSRSTTLTMLRRMTEKGMIACREENSLLVYTSLLDREKATCQETDNFLNRVYQGSISMLLSAVTRRSQLTKEELDNLYRILEEVETRD